MFYVGCTTQKLKLRIAEHMLSIIKKIEGVLMGAAKHFLEQHEGSLSTFCLYGTETVKQSDWGENWSKR